jgi:hypothetical protein
VGRDARSAARARQVEERRPGVVRRRPGVVRQRRRRRRRGKGGGRRSARTSGASVVSKRSRHRRDELPMHALHAPHPASPPPHPSCVPAGSTGVCSAALRDERSESCWPITQSPLRIPPGGWVPIGPWAWGSRRVRCTTECCPFPLCSSSCHPFHSAVVRWSAMCVIIPQRTHV